MRTPGWRTKEKSPGGATDGKFLNSMNRQFPALTGIAMVLIVLNHTIEMGTKALPADSATLGGWQQVLLSLLQALGVFAVPIFLFISGTFISYAAKGEPSRLTRRFVIGSLSHILWPYLIWSFAFYAVIFLQFGRGYSPQGYIKNLLVGYPFHFIPLLIFFYLLSPLLVRFGRQHGSWLILGIGICQLFLLVLLRTDTLPARMKILSPPSLGNTLADWAIYFPLGLVYGLHMNSLLPLLKRIKWLLVFLTLLFFGLGILHSRRILYLPLAGNLAPVALALLLSVIERSSIPLVRRLEDVGKRSYGLYLTHLIVLDLTLLCITTFTPGLLKYQFVLLPLLFLLALLVPMLLMIALSRSPARRIYRYVFG